jgi:hypothetical protein
MPNVIKSDHFNPLVNMKYKENQTENKLEILAVPSFSHLQVEFEDYFNFSKCLYEIV